MSADRPQLRPTQKMDLDAWYRRYGESVYRRSLRLCRDSSTAWDLTQEAFLRAHRHRDTYRGEASPLSWLYAIANRCFLDTLRRRDPVPTSEVEAFVREEQEGADVVFARHDLVARLMAAADRDVREIVLLRFFDELEHQEIADRLGINEKTVRRKLERFLSNARKRAMRR